MSINTYTKLVGGKLKTYYRVYFYDEYDVRKAKTFSSKVEARDFEKAWPEIVGQKKAAISAGIDPTTAVALKIVDGTLNHQVVERVNTIMSKPDNTMKIKDAIDKFIEACEAGRENHKKVRPQTAKTYREKMYPLRDKFGSIQVGRFGADDAKKLRNHLVSVRSTTAQAKNCLVVCKMMFQWLVDDVKEIETNPLASTRIVAEDSVVHMVTEDEIYTDDEIQKLMEAAYAAARSNTYTVERTRDLAVVVLMIYCGLRIGEALAMEWKDVDLDRKVVTVRQTLTKQMTINETKTKQGFRTIALHGKALAALKFAKDRSTGDYVSSVEEGGPMHYRNMKRSLDRLIKAAGIPKRGPHSLRHYFASKLIEAGYEPIALRQQMGHADLAFTDKVYGHIMNKHTRVSKDVDRMSKVDF